MKFDKQTHDNMNAIRSAFFNGEILPAVDLPYTIANGHGFCGDNLELVVRFLVNGKLESVHPSKVADIQASKRVTIECKSGCGWLVKPAYNQYEALAILENGFSMDNAKYIAYVPKFEKVENIGDVRVMTQAQFLEILRSHGKLRIKKGSNGLYGIAIQQYIPTPNFRASKAVYANILDDFNTHGKTLKKWMQGKKYITFSSEETYLFTE